MFADIEADELVDEEELIVVLLKDALPDVTFTVTPSTLTSKVLPFVVVKTDEMDDPDDPTRQLWLVEITSSHETRKLSKELAGKIFDLMGKFHDQSAGSGELGRIASVKRYKPRRYSTADNTVGREHLYHYATSYEIEVDI